MYFFVIIQLLKFKIMKALYVIVLFFGIVSNNNIEQNTETVKAIFDFHDDGTFYFIDSVDENETYTFLKADENAFKTYDLTDSKYEGKVFNVTYRIETEKDDFDEDYEVWTIIKLDMVK